jgi:integrase
MTRRQIAQVMHRILRLAVFPLRLIPANPLPPGFLPDKGPPKAKSCLYPDEDAKLLGSQRVPLCWRMLYGFLNREGPRISEAVRFTWSDADLERGGIVLDVNKTDDPRAWALSPGVAAGLRGWRTIRERALGRPLEPSEPIFVDESGEPITVGSSHGQRFRRHLQLAGIDRPVLFEHNETRLQIRAHDTRSTFITIALANGRSETWISDRTGHKSSEMINRYRRAARTVAELGLGDLAPLDQAIPELAAEGGERKGAGKGGAMAERARKAEKRSLPASDARLSR